MQKTSSFKYAFTLLTAGGLTLCAATVTAADKYYYRYFNKDGVRVINHHIPPRDVKRGYEVITTTGSVIRVVPPSLTEEEIEQRAAQLKQERELQIWDAELRRRYSSSRDVEAAKQRKLKTLTADQRILRGNVKGIQKEIAVQHSKGAVSERRGRPVPKEVLAAIEALESKLELTQAQLTQREQEYQQVSDKFDQDKARYEIIRPSAR